MSRHNPVVYFEIPVSNKDRAIRFYKAVFVVQLEPGELDAYPMAFFPALGNASGATGAWRTAIVPAKIQWRMGFCGRI